MFPLRLMGFMCYIVFRACMFLGGIILMSVYEIWDLAKEYPGIFADAKGSSITFNTENCDEEYLHGSVMECIKKVLGDEYEWR